MSSSMLTRPADTVRVPPSPARRTALSLAGVAVAGGIALAAVWSASLVDDRVGNTVADSVLGYHARAVGVVGSLAGLAFALVSGFAGTFTACNVAVFGALPTVTGSADRQRQRVRVAAGALGWMVAGTLTVAAGYGVLAVLIGRRLPQLSTDRLGGALPERLAQAMIVFGVIGLAFGYLGLAALGLVPDPFARRPRARLVTLGALIGGFLVGRPYPLFHELLDYAVRQHNPLYGALALCLQSLGNVLLMAVIVLVIASGAGRRLGEWLARPPRAAAVAGVALLILGAFLVIYWDVRLPAKFGYGWFPVMPWNG